MKLEPEKSLGLNGIQKSDLCDVDAVLKIYQLIYQVNWEPIAQNVATHPGAFHVCWR